MADKNDMYMEIHTGAVDTEADWIDDIGRDEFDKCVADGSLVEVARDDDGSFVEVFPRYRS